MLTITIIYHEGYALEKDFYVILKNPVGSVELGEPNLARITIIDDDGKLLMTIINILKVDGMSLNELVVCIFFSEPGEFSFEQASYHANIITGEVTCDIVRRKGCDGMVTLTYNTM